MAIVVIPGPKSKYGACEEDCQHRDCQTAKITAALRCIYCNEPLGFDQQVYLSSPSHYACVVIHA